MTYPTGLHSGEASTVAAQFGVALDQVRRDYLISLVLVALQAHTEDLIFFGGTALARTFLTGGRLSDPYITIVSPRGRPVTKPRLRILMSKSMWKAWVNAIGQAGDQNMQQLWNHLAYRPDQPPLLGSVTRLKGGHVKGRDGWSDKHHYEITGAPGGSTTSSTPTTWAGERVTRTRL